MVELVSVLVNGMSIWGHGLDIPNDGFTKASNFTTEMGSFHRVAVLRSYVTTSSIIGITCGAPLGALLTSYLGWQW